MQQDPRGRMVRLFSHLKGGGGLAEFQAMIRNRLQEEATHAVKQEWGSRFSESLATGHETPSSRWRGRVQPPGTGNR